MANEKRLDLIDRQAFIEDIKTEIVNLRLNGMKGTPRPCGELSAFIDRIEAQPGVDAVEVVHGRWDTIWQGEDSRGNVVKCSVCGYKKFDTTDHYCPNCGAKMDGGNEDG